MKLSTKIVSAFALVAIVPVVLTAILLYLYVDSGISETYDRRSQSAVGVARYLITDESARLENAASSLIAETDLVVAIIDWEQRSGDLDRFLRERLARGQFDFAVVRESSLNRKLIAAAEQFPLAPADINVVAAAAAAGYNGIIHLSADHRYPALVAITPIMFRGTLIGELAVGRLLADVVRPLPQIGGLAGVIAVYGRAPLFAFAEDTALVAAAGSIARIEAEQEIWQATLADRQFIVRTAPLVGLDGAPAASLLCIFDAADITAGRARLLQTFSAVAAAAILLALIVGYFVQRSLTRPLQEVAASAKSIAAGAAPERVHYFADDELGDLVGAINRLASDLKDTETRLRQTEQVAAWQLFARQTAHELKNFLMPVAASLAHLQRRADAGVVDRADIDHAVREVYTEIARMKNLLGAFSDFAKMPAPNLRGVNLRHVVERVAQSFADECAAGKLHCDLPPALELVNCDPDQIQQVLCNLVKNSFEAHASMVMIRLTQDNHRTTCEIIDDGDGVDLSRGIDPFTPLFTTKERGSGLGLAVCRRIIVDHGGDIAYAANVPRGTVFTFYLPREAA